MRRSKLLLYVSILKALGSYGPLKLTHIMYKVNVSCSFLREYLDFLIQQEFVKEHSLSGKRVIYAVTERGLSVLRSFRVLDDALLIDERV